MLFTDLDREMCKLASKRRWYDKITGFEKSADGADPFRLDNF